MILLHFLYIEQVKNLYVGENFVGDVPLMKKILAGLTTGEDKDFALI